MSKPNLSETDLNLAFDAVADDADWRGPIDVTMSIEAIDALGGWCVVRTAIEHYTATSPTIAYGLGAESARIQAAGYSAGPAA
jgi:hypothetical protein